jgi:hypothetical protein
MAQLISTAAWPIAILGSVSLGAGLAWAAIGCCTHRPPQRRLFQKGPSEYEHWLFGKSRREPPSTAHRHTVIIFRVIATLAGLFFEVAVVQMVSTPRVLLQRNEQTQY